ncbi:TetR/AcrR family transcriptional regulator [Siminovitchia sp. 179-K 8D1 HS]|uniref:TetR/AcrR family transcriptional regulator n=1 Tax=Siminovitchia sp. 179-K 8D1 HS TaxID=3142385 RepID=UPI0039A140E0
MMKLNSRQKKALETKKRILETALTLFSKKGFDQVTVDEIVETTNTSKGAFYGHFSSKHEIFLEKFKEIDEFYEKFCESLPETLSAETKIIQLAVTQMDYLKNDLGKELMQTIYMNPSSARFLAKTNRKLYKLLNEYIKEGQENGEFVLGIPTEELVMIVTRCMRGTLYDWFIFNEDFDPIEEIRKMLNSVFTGIERK